MTDKGILIKEVCNALDGILKETKGNDLESTAWWTNWVLTALCIWGLQRQFWVGATGMGTHADLVKRAEKCGGMIGNEWLYDFTCLEYTADGWLKRIPLVAECEWSNQDGIYADFEKLLLTRADVRLMIFNGNYFRDEGEKSIKPRGLDVFRRYIRKCEHTRTGDTYLFAARLHEGKGGKSVNHRFDYHLFVA